MLLHSFKQPLFEPCGRTRNPNPASLLAPPTPLLPGGIGGERLPQPPLRLLVGLRRGTQEGSGPASFQAASPPGEGGGPGGSGRRRCFHLEALTEALLVLFTAGDLGRSHTACSVACIATEAEAQPLCRTEPLEARHLPRGPGNLGEGRPAEELWPSANRQAPPGRAAALPAAQARPLPPGRPETREAGPGPPLRGQ